MPTSVQNVTYAIIFGGALSILAALCSLALREKKPDETSPGETSPLINEHKEEH